MKYCTAIQNPHADRSMHQEPRTKNQEQDYRKQKIVEDSEKDGYHLLWVSSSGFIFHSVSCTKPTCLSKIEIYIFSALIKSIDNKDTEIGVRS